MFITKLDTAESSYDALFFISAAPLENEGHFERKIPAGQKLPVELGYLCYIEIMPETKTPHAHPLWCQTGTPFAPFANCGPAWHQSKCMHRISGSMTTIPSANTGCQVQPPFAKFVRMVSIPGTLAEELCHHSNRLHRSHCNIVYFDL